jgi:hypothetical protein
MVGGLTWIFGGSSEEKREKFLIYCGAVGL